MSDGDEVWVMMVYVHELVVDALPGINDLSRVCMCVSWLP